jgi:hypothetical protein
MGITDELRKYAQSWRETPNLMDELDAGDIDGLLGDIEHIADCIDAEHEKACNDAWNNGYEADYLGIEKWLTEHPQAMEHHGWVRLPKDADGEYIHIGDVMETERFGVVEVEGFIHNAIAFNVYDPQPARICTVPAKQCNHHHAPTVEDVLREFAEKVIDSQIPTVHPTYEEAIAEYAARLRLADDWEEQ